MKEMYTLNNIYSKSTYGEISSEKLVEKKSSFISYIFKIENEEQATKYIDNIRNNNKDARHVVYIYSYIKDNVVNIRFSDDGEPKGTGTKAIYELLTKENITNICIVIVRYFGGILLGAGPLSRAYLNTAREAIIPCKKEVLHNYIEYKDTITYSRYQMIKSIIDKKVEEGIIQINDIIFTDNVTIILNIIDNYFDEIVNIIKD